MVVSRVKTLYIFYSLSILTFDIQIIFVNKFLYKYKSVTLYLNEFTIKLSFFVSIELWVCLNKKWLDLYLSTKFSCVCVFVREKVGPIVMCCGD